MKEKILSLLGFPPPAPLDRLSAPWQHGEVSNSNKVVIDAHHVKNATDLKELFQQFQSGLKDLKPNGKMLVYSHVPELLEDVGHATFQRSIEGMTRSLAKEIGAKGKTVNLVRLPEGVSSLKLKRLEEFFTTGRSAFITGQALTLNDDAPPEGELTDKVCVVTGGAGGIGSATVKRLEAEGATVIIADIPPMRDKAAPLLSDLVSFHAVDLTDAKGRQELLEMIKEKHGKLDVLINNAGITRDKTMKNMPEHFWDQVVAINLQAVIDLTEEALKMELIPQHGRIINTSSISGIAGNFGQTNYTATKSALIGYTAKKAVELRPKGMTINAIAPGFIETEMVKTMPVMTRVFAERLTSLAQAGKPSDIAEAMAFLAHPSTQPVNGQVLRVCGGSFLGA